MRDEIKRTRQCEFRTAENGEEKWLEGYFAVFDDVYDMGGGITESIAPDAFDKYLDNDIRVLLNHNTSIVLGRTKAGTANIKKDDHGIYVRCKINPDDTDAMNAYARTKRGDVSQASFGGYIIAEENETRDNGTHYRLTDIDVFEFSLCTFPAYEGTEVGVRTRRNKNKNDEWKSKMEERINKWH